MLSNRSSLFQILGSVFILILLAWSSSNAQPAGYKTRDVIYGVNIPWEMRWGPDNWIWFTERIGTICKVNPETGEKKLLRVESDVHQVVESGMLGLDFHPNFPDSPYVYSVFTYIDSVSVPGLSPMFMKVVRYTYENDTLAERVTIFDKINGRYIHNGSRIIVTKDRKIFITAGENYFPEWAQIDSLPNGKILRINIDGSIPEDNPWPGSPVWTKGHRNPQGLCFGPDGTLYSSEHGEDTDDEVNVILKKRNYGWPAVRGYCDSASEMTFCNDSNVVEALRAWTPTIAVCGLEYYHSDLYPDWTNCLLLATLKDASLYVLPVDTVTHTITGEQRLWMLMTSDTLRHAGRLRDVCISPTGRVFISTSNSIGENKYIDGIFEIIPDHIKDVPQDEKKTESIVVSPNPSSEYITISNLPSRGSIVEVLDQLGRSVYSSVASSGQTTISVHNFARGAYYVRMMSGSTVQTVPVIIK